MYRTFTEIKDALKKGKSVQNILSIYLSNIEKEKTLNAFIEVFEDSAQKKALEVDEKLKNGTAGKLAGMVIGLKDNICYQDHRVSVASKMLDGFESLYSATVVQKLLDEDAIIIGRLNSDEFSMGSSNQSSFFGAAKNAVNPEYVPGGSSGGSATAVAGNLCTVALGSDTGGSIRQPTSFTGTIGLKPTYGRISRYGLIALASSFDQIGAIANDLNDVALVTEVMAGKDEMDNTSSSKEVPSYIPESSVKKLRIAYLEDAIEDDCVDSEIKERTKELISSLQKEGHELVPFSLNLLKQIVPTYYILTSGEASSNLSRYDGIHFGYRSPNANGIEEIYVKSRTEGFGDEVKRRIMTGMLVTSKNYYDAYYGKAQKVRRLIKERTEEILTDFDFILLPTTPTTAFKLNESLPPLKMYLQDIFTVLANLSGNPAISLPLGRHSNGLPFGIQLMARKFEEKELINVSNYLLKHHSL